MRAPEKLVVGLLLLAAASGRAAARDEGAIYLDEEGEVMIEDPGEIVMGANGYGVEALDAWLAYIEESGSDIDPKLVDRIKKCNGRAPKYRSHSCWAMLKHEKHPDARAFIREVLGQTRRGRGVGGIGGEVDSQAVQDHRGAIAASVRQLRAPEMAAAIAALPAPGEAAAAGRTDADVSARGILAAPEMEMPGNAMALAFMDEMPESAVVTSGALPIEAADGNWSSWAGSAERHNRNQKWHFLNTDQHDVYAAGMQTIERNETWRARGAIFNASAQEEFEIWFAENGGLLHYADRRRRGGADSGPLTGFTASEDIVEGDVVLRVNSKMIIGQPSLRLVRSSYRKDRLHKRVTPVFKEREEWGLATFLLIEWEKREGSLWFPFIRLLRMRALRDTVLLELANTWAVQLLQELDDEVSYLRKHLGKTLDCDHDSKDLCMALQEPQNLRWALYVVRRHAVQIRKRTTNNPFLALVPMAHLMPHAEGASGSFYYELDNHITLSGVNCKSGAPLSVDRGNFSDAEQLVRFHRVQAAPNPHNAVRFTLPGNFHPLTAFMWFPISRLLHEWRQILQYPMRQAMLYDGARKMMLYGDGTDEDEMESFAKVKKVDAQRVNDLVESGAAFNPEEAALILSGADADERRESRRKQMYTAVEPDSDIDQPQEGRNTLASGYIMLQNAIAAQHVDRSVLRAINMTKEFYLEGLMPLRGLDPIDKLMKRKLQLLQFCGNYSDFVITPEGVSDALFCNVRVHIMNETDLDITCPQEGDGPWQSGHCCKKPQTLWSEDKYTCEEGGSNHMLNVSLPVSKENEIAAIRVLFDAIKVMLNGLEGGSASDDLELLERHLDRDGDRETIMSSTLRYRAREKKLLEDTMRQLSHRLTRLDDLPFQVEGLRAERAKEQRAKDRLVRLAEELRNASSEAPVVANLTVNMGGEAPTFVVVREGDSREAIVNEFAKKHGLTAEGKASVVNGLAGLTRAEPALVTGFAVVDGQGVRRVLTVKEGQNATEEAQRFCIRYNISNFVTDDVQSDAFGSSITERAESDYNATVHRAVLAELPVSLPDGRQGTVRVRAGAQHDLHGIARVFVDAYALHSSMVEMIAQELHKRLAPAVHFHPVTIDNFVYQLRITSRDPAEIERIVTEFADYKKFPLENVPVIRQSIMGGLHPDAVLAPAKPLRD